MVLSVSPFNKCPKFILNVQKQVCVNVKGPVPVHVDGVKRAAEVPKAVVAQKKVNVVKPKAKEVIEISPDTEEEIDLKAKQEKPVNKKKEGAEGTSRKKAPTLTSVLTARSKVRILVRKCCVSGGNFTFYGMLVLIYCHCPSQGCCSLW